MINSKAFSFSGPKASITGIAVSVQNLTMTGKGVAVACLFTEICRAISPYTWVDITFKMAAVSICLGAILAPRRSRNGDDS